MFLYGADRPFNVADVFTRCYALDQDGMYFVLDAPELSVSMYFDDLADGDIGL